MAACGWLEQLLIMSMTIAISRVTLVTGAGVVSLHHMTVLFVLWICDEVELLPQEQNSWICADASSSRILTRKFTETRSKTHSGVWITGYSTWKREWMGDLCVCVRVRERERESVERERDLKGNWLRCDCGPEAYIHYLLPFSLFNLLRPRGRS